MTDRVQGSMAAPNDKRPMPGWDAHESADVTIARLGRLLAPLQVAGRDVHTETLNRVIESQVIPHLITVHRPASLDEDSREVVELTQRVIALNPDAGLQYVEDLLARGMAQDAICLDVLAPTARRLGQLWTEDRVDFTEVTIGLLRLQRLLKELNQGFRPRMSPGADGRWALLAAVPGEQHTFGVAMVAEFFRREGWYVRSAALASTAELALMVRNEWFAVVGLSAGTTSVLSNVISCVQMIRAASCNPAIAVLAGGPLFTAHPEYVSAVGADATATDARDAARAAEALLAERASRD